MSSIRDFVPLSKLGEGSFSSVYKVRRVSDQKIYALKKVRMNNLSTKEKENALNEVRILASIQSEYIIGYKEAFFDDKVNLLCIVMEFADGGDLHKMVNEKRNSKKSISESEVWKAVHDILNGLITLHAKGILHRDLKSANIFLMNGKYKLGDLNVSKVNGGNLAYTQTGTPYYASPQVWRDQPYGAKSDIWSFGCIVFEMIALRPPFEGRDMEDLYRSVQHKTYNKLPYSCSKELQLLVKDTLEKNPSLRKSAQQILRCPQFTQLFPKATQPKLKSPQLLVNNNKNSSRQLLKTIKLPTDLKSLKSNLPNSKYDEDLSHGNEKQLINLRENHSQVQLHSHNMSDRPPVMKNMSLVSHLQKKHIALLNQNLRSPSKRVNQSDIYQYNPSGKKVEGLETPTKNLSQLQQRPQFQSESPKMKVINRKVEERQGVGIRLSERIFNSDSKRQPIVSEKSNARNIIDQYLQESGKKRPITSMPRTEKRSIINSYSIETPTKDQYEDLKSKLVKKARVVSNRYPKPSWWG